MNVVFFFVSGHSEESEAGATVSIAMTCRSDTSRVNTVANRLFFIPQISVPRLQHGTEFHSLQTGDDAWASKATKAH